MPGETPLGGWGLQIFLAKSMGIPAIYTKFKLKVAIDKLEFYIYMAEITSDLAQEIRRPPAEGLRTISAGTTLLVHTVVSVETILF